MKKLLILLPVLFIASCNSEQIDPIDPIADLTSDKSYLIVEIDGKTHSYIEGNADVEIRNIFSTSTQHPNSGHGGVFSMKDGLDWWVSFFFSKEDLKANKVNAKKLYDVKKYDFVKLNRDYDYSNIFGVEIGYSKDQGNGTALGENTLYQENQKPQNFEVTKVYLSPTYDGFVFVEGNFDCWVGDFDVRKNIKGKFRVEVQVSE